MKRKLISIILIMLSLTNLGSVSTSSNLDISAYLYNNTSKRSLSYEVTSVESGSIGSGDYEQLSYSYIGDTPIKLFSWNLNGNLYGYTYKKNTWNTTSYTNLKVIYTMTPLSEVSNSSLRIPYYYLYDADYTYLESTYLGLNGAYFVHKGTTYTDTITPSIGSSTYQSIDGIDVNGKFLSSVSTNQTITYKYKLSADSGYSYFWSRTGNICVNIKNSDYESASAGTYRATITVAISLE